MKKTFTIVSRGRKYFAAKLSGKYACKLLINEVSQGLSVGETVTLEVEDFSKRGRFGSSYIYVPLAVHVFSQQEELTNLLDAIEKRLAEGKPCSRLLEEASLRCAALQDDGPRPRLETLDKRSRVTVLLNKIERQLAYEWRSSELLQSARELCASLQDDDLRQRLDNLTIRSDALEMKLQKASQERQQQRAYNQTHRTLYPLGEMPPLNTPVRLGTAVVVYTGTGKRFQIDENAPSVHGSHLLGHEGDRGCFCYWREATEEETASLKADEEAAVAARQSARERRERLKAIAALIREHGEQPPAPQTPEGEEVLSTRNIYGGGEWFVIGTEHIWYIRNNGADGDMWGANNVITGGAGAIGWRIRFDMALAEELRTLHEEKRP